VVVDWLISQVEKLFEFLFVGLDLPSPQWSACWVFIFAFYLWRLQYLFYISQFHAYLGNSLFILSGRGLRLSIGRIIMRWFGFGSPLAREATFGAHVVWYMLVGLFSSPSVLSAEALSNSCHFFSSGILNGSMFGGCFNDL